ncbi:CadD family cadmium resistance transporter [Lentibacillus sp. N15]|uniref:CadD family cadmium resistance transporter n=1 Tax=Lentibacillus songyuanensis TaxID=3136161 RepID=UPI0031BA0E33
MFQVIVTAAILYIATAVDLLVLLLIFFAKAKTKKQYIDIYIGQYIGSLTLIAISLFLAYVLNFVPEKWILGLLGLIPIYFGLKVAIFSDDDEGEEVESQLDKKGLSKLAKTVTLITIVSCGADNIGLFVPYFLMLNINELIVTILVFVVLIFVLVFTAQKLSNIPGIGEVVEKFSRWIMATVYIVLGVFIIYENETIQTLLSFLN